MNTHKEDRKFSATQRAERSEAEPGNSMAGGASGEDGSTESGRCSKLWEVGQRSEATEKRGTAQFGPWWDKGASSVKKPGCEGRRAHAAPDGLLEKHAYLTDGSQYLLV